MRRFRGDDDDTASFHFASFVSDGYRAVKLKCGALSLRDEVARIRVVREANGDSNWSPFIETIGRKTRPGGELLSFSEIRIQDGQLDYRDAHNHERLNDIAAELHEIDTHLNEHDEHNTLVEARISGYQFDINGLSQRVQDALDKVSAYLHSMAELEGDMRKRQIIALEKEIRDVRSKGLTFDAKLRSDSEW